MPLGTYNEAPAVLSPFVRETRDLRGYLDDPKDIGGAHAQELNETNLYPRRAVVLSISHRIYLSMV